MTDKYWTMIKSNPMPSDVDRLLAEMSSEGYHLVAASGELFIFRRDERSEVRSGEDVCVEAYRRAKDAIEGIEGEYPAEGTRAGEALYELLDAHRSQVEQERAREKARRTYYQDIVYDVCRWIDRTLARDKGVTSGSVVTPSHEIQKALREIRDRLMGTSEGSPSKEQREDCS